MKLLVLTSRFPYPLEKGDKLRIYHQLQELAKYHEVTLCALTDHEVSDENFLAVSRFCARVEVIRRSKFSTWKNMAFSLLTPVPVQVAHFFDKKGKQQFHQLAEQVRPDHIYCQLIRTAPYAADLAVPKTLDFMDNFSRWTLKLAGHQRLPPAKWFLRWEAKKVAAYEKTMFKKFDCHTVISEQDRAAFQFAERNKIHCIGNGVDTGFFQPKTTVEKRFDVAFVGNLGYVNNVEAAKFIAKKIAPLVQEKMPGTKFLIAGARPAPEVQRLENEHVTIQGWLDDIRDAYASSRVFAAPIFLAVGQQNKILEAMAMGLPCVTTPQVNNAIGAVPGESVLLATNAKEFAERIVFLLKNEAEQRQFSELGSSFVLKNFSWETTVGKLRKLMEKTSQMA